MRLSTPGYWGHQEHVNARLIEKLQGTISRDVRCELPSLPACLEPLFHVLYQLLCESWCRPMSRPMPRPMCYTMCNAMCCTMCSIMCYTMCYETLSQLP